MKMQWQVGQHVTQFFTEISIDVVEDNSKIIEQTVKKIIMVEIDGR